MISDFLRLLRGFILFIGPSEAGKTSILRRLVKGTFEEQVPTLGFLEEYIANVKIIEIGGQETYRHYWNTALEQNPVHIFFVIDITSKGDFDEYFDILVKIRSENPHLVDKITLIGNKMDLITKIPSYLANIEQKILCSAKEGEGMLDILEEIAALRRHTDPEKGISKAFQSEKKERIEEKQKVEELLKSFHGRLNQSE